MPQTTRTQRGRAGRWRRGPRQADPRMAKVKALRSFTVRTQLPPSLADLQALAGNLRWSWDDRARRLFRWVDAELWEKVDRDPVRLLSMVSQKRLTELSSDTAFMGF